MAKFASQKTNSRKGFHKFFMMFKDVFNINKFQLENLIKFINEEYLITENNLLEKNNTKKQN